MNRVLVVGFTDNPGGIENVVMNYYRKIDKTKIQFDFLYSTDNIAFGDEINNLGGRTYKIEAKHRDYHKYKKDIKLFFEKNAHNYSAIWVNFCNITNLDYLKLAKKHGIRKRIIHAHNSQNMGSFLKGLLHKINRVFISRYATDFWTCNPKSNKWFYGNRLDKSKRIIAINNAIDTTKFKFDKSVRITYREKLGINDKLVIGHVGRFHFQKNQLFLLDIFNEIQKKEPNSVLLLVGQGEDEKKILDKIQQLKLQEKVKMLGVRDDINDLMCAMDVFLFPSLFEGLGLVLVEAQATNLPVVASCDDVPQNVKLSENFTFLSLNEPLELWAKSVIDFKNSVRTEDNSFVKSSIYDIDGEVKKIEMLFEKN